jgi:5-formyltetrahydrofolate cyclo-ligase
MVSEEKSQLRKKALAKRRRLFAINRIQQIIEIEKRFFALPEYASAGVIAFYASKVDEVSTDGLIEKSLADGKKVLLPRIRGKNLVWGEIKNMRNLIIGDFAVREPPLQAPDVDLKKVDLIVVPLVVCDLRGNRLGYGSGFYDRVLSEFEGASVGLAFDCQVVDKVPTEEWDQKMGKILIGA